jgi:threonine/homoserine/homoserine lactone efflux protein
MWKQLLPLMTYCLVMSGTPGPNNVMLATSGARFGYRGALPQILGQNVGISIQTFVTCMGLGSLFVAYPILHNVLRITGAVYLVYLAWKLSGSSIGAATESQPLTFWEAALFQGINPKSWVKSVTLASVFMPTGLSLAAGSLLVTLIGSLIALPSASMWALFGVAIRKVLTNPRKQRAFNLCMGATLVALAVNFLR